ncbi:c-type cytochrome biogenesis protein CcmI [Neotabrizicola sp. VNH66]|uniref:c-type cytochrome biogenesis protein CcmI n=1 Tax=Neotabrizicola sp. VNH66 TaxID=3400918 RepID=UPI003C100498
MENGAFWLAAGLMAALTAAGLAAAMLRAARRATDSAALPAGTEDLRIYRDQLTEVERDLARGTLPEAEATRLRTEIARRLLEADRKRQASVPKGALRPATLIGGLAAVLLACAAALLLYDRLGTPGYPDVPLAARLAEADRRMADRPGQAEAEATAPALSVPPPDAEFTALMDKLRAAVDPATATDQRGLDLLARNEFALGNFPAAIAAQQRLIAVKGGAATADDHAMLADMLVAAAGGYVSPEAEAAIVAALQLDPRHGLATYYAGLMFAQNGRFDRAFALWRPLLEDGPQDAPWVPALREDIAEIAFRAGVNYTPPAAAAASGPTAEDVAAAEDMAPADRQAMIEGMVAQLGDRLATEGGPAEDWARLIRALGVLGRTEEARAILTEAQTRFAGQEADLAALSAAATDAGIAE